MKLYYCPGTCATGTHIVLEWIGEPYVTHRVAIQPPKSPELVAANPSGAVPVLDVDGWVLTQNAAILNYLADAYPKAKLGGDGTPRSRAEVNRWVGLINSDMHPHFGTLFTAASWLDDTDAVRKVTQHAKTIIRKNFEILSKQMVGRSWIAGTRSIADPYLFVVLRWAKAMKLDLSGLAELDAFYQRITADAAVKKVLAAEAA